MAAEVRRPMPVAFERGAACVRCAPKGAQRSKDLPPRSEGKLDAPKIRTDSCMRGAFCICLTFEFTRVRKRAKPAVAGRVQRRVRPHWRTWWQRRL